MAFPAAPINGQVYTTGGVTYVFSSTKNAWQIQTFDTVDAAGALTSIKTVDGASSGLDADLLDGYTSGDFWRKAETVNAGTLDGIDSTQFLKDNGWNTSPGQDANSQPEMMSDFTYSNNAPWTGNLIRFGASGYSLQLSSLYNGSGNGLSFRTYNNDSVKSWNPWYTIWHSGNDGAGSGLDADTLDGIQASAFTQTVNGAINLPTGSADPASTTTGAIYYNTTDATIKQYTGSEWVAVYQKPDGTTMNLAVDKSTDIPQGYPTGWYWINVDGTPQQFWVDMDYDGGGWVLVATHTINVGLTSTTWAESTTGTGYVQKAGGWTPGVTDPRSTTVLLPLHYWPKLSSANGNSAYKVMAHTYTSNGVSPASSSMRSRWTFTGWDSLYRWQGAANLSNEVGGTSPGVWTYHIANSYPWSAYDADYDANSTNCAANYNNHPFWYGACWDGNWYGGGTYQNAWYWTGSSGAYYAYGAAYVK